MNPTDKKDFLSVLDLTADQLADVLASASELKSAAGGRDLLRGRSLAMVFRKSSTRTRVSFEVGMTQLGGHAVFLSDSHSQMGRNEPVADTARVLGRYVDGIMVRTFAHAEVVEMAHWSPVPVINGLTDLLHPCQLLADLLTAREEFGPDLGSLRVAWIGDGNNMANSWLNSAHLLGFSLKLACPDGYDPDPDILERAVAGGRVQLVRDPGEAVRGANVVTTDVWASMGQEDEADKRAGAFEGYLVDDALMAAAAPDAIFLHCLPAHRGEEVSDAVIEGARSRVFQQAENRLHAQKALLVALLGSDR